MSFKEKANVLLSTRASEFCQPKAFAGVFDQTSKSEAQPLVAGAAAEVEEEDPLDAFMDGIQKDAVVQEAVTVEQSTERELAQLQVQEGEEVIDEDSDEGKELAANNVITLEDIMGIEAAPTTDLEVEDDP